MKYGHVLGKALRDGKPFQHSGDHCKNDSPVNEIRFKGRSFAW
jgi:hypothetical protein